jgi:hypothetical protein
VKSKLAIAASTPLLLAACAGTTIGLDNSNAPLVRGGAPAPGSFYNAASIHAELRPNAYFGLFFLGYVAAGAQDNYSSWNYGPAGRKPPQLAEERTVAERDCSQPMELPSANLRCR